MAVNQRSDDPGLISIYTSKATRQELEAWNACETCGRMTQMRELEMSPVTGIWVLAAVPAVRDLLIMTRADAPPLQAFSTL